MNTTEAEQLARSIMDKHGLTDWTFDFDRSVRRFGATWHSLKRITLSRKLVELNDTSEVRSTIYHEVAHALCDRSEHHGSQWQAKMLELGRIPNMYYNARTVATPPAKYIGACPNCNRKIVRNKRTKIACGTCCKKYNRGKFDAQYLFVYRETDGVGL